MADEKLLALLRQGVEAWNEWRRQNRDVVRSDLDLSGADLRKAKLSSAILSKVNLREADLRKANLSSAKLNKADLREANLCEANFTWANLRNVDFRGAKLIGAKLKGANLFKARLSGTNLRLVQAYEANLREAQLRGANLSEANFTGANLREARLSQTNLSEANLNGASLRGAKLTKAELRGTYLAGTLFVNVDLSGVDGLEECKHLGPSIVDFRTLQRSGPLPLGFLRGCGLPDNVIEYLPSLLNQPIQFYSCFLSHSSKDDEFARRLYADLQDKGVRCWFAPEDMKIGDRIRDRIDEVIRLRDKLLVVLSENSIASQWVEDEVEAALEEERSDPDRRTVLFPVRIDDAIMSADRAWARTIKRTRHIGDFTRWKEHDAYQVGLERLLRDLKPELERKPSDNREE